MVTPLIPKVEMAGRIDLIDMINPRMVYSTDVSASATPQVTSLPKKPKTVYWFNGNAGYWYTNKNPNTGAYTTSSSWYTTDNGATWTERSDRYFVISSNSVAFNASMSSSALSNTIWLIEYED